MKLLTIFVSCPQDLAPERSVLESVIDELNQKLRDSHSVEFRTMGWGSLVPGVGLVPNTAHTMLHVATAATLFTLLVN